jgi:hypothetical protein
VLFAEKLAVVLKTRVDKVGLKRLKAPTKHGPQCHQTCPCVPSNVPDGRTPRRSFSGRWGGFNESRGTNGRRPQVSVPGRELDDDRQGTYTSPPPGTVKRALERSGPRLMRTETESFYGAFKQSERDAHRSPWRCRPSFSSEGGRPEHD